METEKLIDGEYTFEQVVRWFRRIIFVYEGVTYDLDEDILDGLFTMRQLPPDWKTVKRPNEIKILRKYKDDEEVINSDFLGRKLRDVVYDSYIDGIG